MNSGSDAARNPDGRLTCALGHSWLPSFDEVERCPRCGGRPFTREIAAAPRRGWGFYAAILLIPPSWIFSITLGISAFNDPQLQVSKIAAASVLFVSCVCLFLWSVVVTARYEFAVDQSRAKSLAEIFGLTLHESPPPDVVQLVMGLDMVRKKRDVELAAVLTGELDEREVIGGRLSWWEGSDSHGDRISKRLLIFPNLGQNLPAFKLRSREALSQWFFRLIGGWGASDGKPFRRQFACKYSLKGPKPERIKEIFDDMLMEVFAGSPNWFISNDHGHIIFERVIPDPSFKFRMGKSELEPPAAYQCETYEMAIVLARQFDRRTENTPTRIYP